MQIFLVEDYSDESSIEFLDLRWSESETALKLSILLLPRLQMMHNDFQDVGDS